MQYPYLGLVVETVHDGDKIHAGNNVADLRGHTVPSDVVILHWESWCPHVHRPCNDYIRSHPDEDTAWIAESYDKDEWVKILTDANMVGAIPRKYR